MTRRAWLLWAVLTVLLGLTFRTVVEGDGAVYYSYLHTLLVDHDLDFSNEYAAALSSGVPLWPDWLTTRSSTGLLTNYYTVGCALLSAPFYVAAFAIHPDGRPLFGPPFTTAYVLASLFWGLLALALSYRFAAEVTGSGTAALLGAGGAALATPLTFYLLYDPSYSHTFSAFATAAFLYAWWRRPASAAAWFGVGALAGLTALVRYQDGLVAAVVLLDLPRARWRFLLAVGGALVVFAPQLAIGQVLFGSWVPQLSPNQRLQLWPGHHLDLLFASNHGLFTWVPLTLVAIYGLAKIEDRRLQLGALIALLGQVLLQGSASDWWTGHSFGPRRFCDLAPLYALGAAAAAARVGWRPALGGLAGLVAWNFVLIANFVYVIRVDVDPGYAGLLAGQLKALPYVTRLFATGDVVRALVLWPFVHRPFDPLLGVSLWLLEAGAAAIAFRVGTVLTRSQHA